MPFDSEDHEPDMNIGNRSAVASQAPIMLFILVD
jgi:hypothetical protein